MTATPLHEYTARAGARRATLAARQATATLISHLRLATFVIALVIAALAWRGTLAALWLLPVVVVFVVLVVKHDRVLRARDRAARAVEFYERGLARIGDHWIGTGSSGERFQDDSHPYASDLDLFGTGSLFELISIARTRAGEDTLAAWLKDPADRGELGERQEAIRELTDALDLRESLSIAGTDATIGLDAGQLRAWAEAPPHLEPWRQQAAAALTVAACASIALCAATGAFVPLLIVLMAQGLFQMRHRERVNAVLHGAETRARDLATLLDLLGHVERYRFVGSRLLALQNRVITEGAPASVVVRRLQLLIEAHDWEHNIVFALVAFLLMWSTHLAGAVERWRVRHGRHAPGWLQAVGEIEAFSSFSAYRYEHADDPFPELVGTAAGRTPALFDGRGLGHPLVPSGRMVRNDVHLEGDVALLVVSGSNMSGKSTLLRTVGVNTVLALAGAPVRATGLRISPMALGATLRIQDSLQEGRSRFYAEITRVRAIVEHASGGPLLFLLDELFHGTNSHDRLVGASGVLDRLLDLGAIGLITTHDLALTAVADRLAPRAQNVHFEDRFEDGEMLFDYRMKPGPVTRSNALALMRAVGLDV